MTAPVVLAAPAAAIEPRPGSRAARFAMPRAVDALRQLATEYGVCARPVLLRRTDLTTGATEVIDIPCGATREDKCATCAKRARRLRQQQCREGWHRADEPLPDPHEPSEGQRALIELRAHFVFERGRAEAAAEWGQVADLEAAIAEVDQAITESGLRGRLAPVGKSPSDGEDQADDERKTRRVRSTRRRQDAPDLPRHPVLPTTVGRTYAGRDGRVFQPSTFLTLTLDSYGRVRDDGTPVRPDRYDYRRAAWDAVHFPALLDRFWQNLIGSEPASTGWDRSAHGRLWQNSALEVLAAGWRVEPIGFQPSRWRSTGALAGASSSHLAWVILRGSTSFTVVV